MNILRDLISLLRKDAPFFLHLTAEHLLISLSAIAIATLVGVLLGIFISEYRKYAVWLLGAVNVLYTIPSIALLGFFITITGVGNLTALDEYFLVEESTGNIYYQYKGENLTSTHK